MTNYRFLIEYDGTRYYGWQRQPEQNTIQGKLESVLSVMCGKEIEIIGAGRTDSGVHARGMTANAVLDTEKNAEEIRDYLNRYLPDDIAVLEVKEASPRFHARYNATGKTYCYTCYDGDVRPVFDRKYYTWLEEKPDVEKMRGAAEVLLGQHDFRNFCVNPRMKKSTVRCVDKLLIERDGGYIRFIVHGTGFAEYGAYYGWDAAGGWLWPHDSTTGEGGPGKSGETEGRAYRTGTGIVSDKCGL